MSVIGAVVDSVNSLTSFSTDFFWDNSVFSKENWEKAMRGTRIALTMTGVFLLVYELRARRLGDRIPEKTRRMVAYIMTLLAFGVYFDFGNPNTRYKEYYHRHEFYHYYLGSKYSAEVGYKLLYECTAIAEIELGRGAQVRKRDIRDLRVNLIKPMEATNVVKNPQECKSRFAPARWDTFKQDVDWFYKSAAGDYWENMMKDHGYNPPPVWTMEGKFFGKIVPPNDPNASADANFQRRDKYFKILSSVDVLFHVGTVLLVFWAFGWRAMAVMTVFWGCNAPANFYWTGGAFLRQDWLFFLIAALCCTRKKKFLLAGAALTWSALLRVFPLLMFFGWGVIIGFYLLERVRKKDWKSPKDLLHPTHWRLLTGVALALAVLVPSSLAVAGKDSYKNFWQHTIETHRNTPLTNDMGLETMVTHTWQGRMRFARDDNYDDPFELWKIGRTQRMHERKPIFFAITAFIALWTAWALRRTKLLWVGLALSCPMVMCLTNLTCYYYSFFLTAAALVLVRPQLGPALLFTSGASTILLDPPKGFFWVDDRYTALTYLFAALAVLMLFAYSRPFSMERLKAWWEFRREPRTKSFFTSPPDPAPTETSEAKQLRA